MAEHDKYEKDILKALQNIVKSLNNIDKDLKQLYGLSKDYCDEEGKMGEK